MVDKWSWDYRRRIHARACLVRVCVHARAQGGIPHLLVLPVSIVVKELQTKRPRQVHVVSDRMQLSGVLRDEVLVASGVGHTAWSLSTSACRIGSSSCQ